MGVDKRGEGEMWKQETTGVLFFIFIGVVALRCWWTLRVHYEIWPQSPAGGKKGKKEGGK